MPLRLQNRIITELFMLEQKKILVVEDHPDSAEMVEKLLKALGCPTVWVATNGPDALEIAYESIPDLILLDVVLPKMSGLEVARRLKADPHTSAIPILALTAKAMEGDRERCLEGGCDGYLSKPFLPQQLKAEIAKLLGLSFPCSPT